ncbi:TonB-dependent siderophore receptor [Thauera sp. SDU_THAU2]|uniref:TonB-dependent siderophore receptor n=1 Tax=Thauera sp. SDU_THAU2 TaxID=3136633 RepID=UPI00311FF2AC
MQTRQPRPLRPLAAHLRTALVGLACAAVLPHAPAIAAEPPASATAGTYALPAGPLSQTLYQFAAQAGITLTFDATLTDGLQSSGLDGSYSPEAGLGRLLAGSGLEAVQGKNGGYRLRRLPASRSEARLTPVMVTGTAERSGTTEGTGSYAPTGPVGTGTPLGLTVKETPQSVSVITKQRMEDQGLINIRQVLEQAPGIVLSSMGTERYYPISRGYTVNNFQLDGVSSYAEYYGLGDVSPQGMADMAVYDRVEILRGASGLVSGAGNPSGTINMVRKKPTDEFQGSVEANLGSWNNKGGTLDLSGPLNRTKTVRGRLVASWQDGDSFIDDYSKNKQLFYGVVEADITERTKVTLGLEHQKNEFDGQMFYMGFPLWYSDGTRTDLPRSFNSGSRDNSLDIRSTTVFATLDQKLAGDWKLKISANGMRSTQDNRVAYLAFASTIPDKNTGDGLSLFAEQYDYKVRTESLDINIQGPVELFDRQHELVFGLDYLNFESNTGRARDVNGLHASPVNLYSWDHSGRVVPGETYLEYDSTRRQKGLYGAGRFHLGENLKFITGARVFSFDADYVTSGAYYSSSPQSEDHVFTPYAGLVYDLNKSHSVYASYTTIYKPQNVQDRSGAYLDPLEGDNYELGLKSTWLGNKLQTAASLYQIRQDNLSERDPGQTVAGTTTAAYRAVKGAKTEGFDLEAFGELTRNWNISASYAYSQTQDAGGQRIKADFPRHMVKFWTSYRLPGEFNRLTIGGGAIWQSKTDSTINVWMVNKDLSWEQKAYTVANLMARYDVSDNLAVTLNVNNVFDKKYIASVFSTYYSGMYGTPRDVQLNVKYRF